MCCNYNLRVRQFKGCRIIDGEFVDIYNDNSEDGMN